MMKMGEKERMDEWMSEETNSQQNNQSTIMIEILVDETFCFKTKEKSKLRRRGFSRWNFKSPPQRS